MDPQERKWADFRYKTKPSPGESVLEIALAIGGFLWQALFGLLIFIAPLAISLPAIIGGILGLLPLIIFIYLIVPH